MSDLTESKTTQDAPTQPATPQRNSRRGIIVVAVLVLLVVTGIVIYRKAFPDYDRPVVGDKSPEEQAKVQDELDKRLKDTNADAHPLDPALKIADKSLQHIQANIADYTCIMTKQERLGDKVGEEQKIFCKVRNRKVDEDDEIVMPLSVYMRFIKPKKGREVIWVEGKNDGKLTAHEPGGLIGLKTWHLPHDGKIAMMGQRYPISQTGFENLVYQLIDRGLKELKYDKSETEVKIDKDFEFNGRSSTKIVVRHPKESDLYDFYEGRIIVDNEWNIPVHYSAYLWPEKKGGELPLIESYTYTDIKLNVGLTDEDFNSENPEYNFP